MALEAKTRSESRLENLKNDLGACCFSYLDEKSQCSFGSTSKTMYAFAIEAIKNQANEDIRNYVKDLDKNLQKQGVQNPIVNDPALQSIISQGSLLKFSSFTELKNTISDLETKLQADLETLSLDNITNLANIQVPKCWNRISKLMELYNGIKNANSIPDEDTKSWTLANIVTVCLPQGSMDRALELVNTIPNEDAKSWALEVIATDCLGLGDIDRAFAAANSIPNEHTKTWTLKAIATDCLGLGDIDRAFAAANSIPNEHTKTWTLKAIATDCLGRGDIDRALEIANTIPNEDAKSWALKDIATDCLGRGDIDRALAAANSIPNEHTKSFALVDIAFFHATSLSANFIKTWTIAQAIPDVSIKHETFFLIVLWQIVRIAAFIIMAWSALNGVILLSTNPWLLLSYETLKICAIIALSSQVLFNLWNTLKKLESIHSYLLA